jgi:uncharacterized OsmC-like protein
MRQAMDALSAHFAQHPHNAVAPDRPAIATVTSGLRCEARGPKGELLVTDMPPAIDGEGSAPTPGWFLRAALASCDATVITMRAAQLGITLERLEVEVGGTSDHRGLLGVDDRIPAGPLALHVTVRIAAPGASDAQLHELVAWSERHSPVGDALRRALPVTLHVVTGAAQPSA